jgi:hypothetical protein
MRIVLHIDRFVLDGFPMMSAQRLGEAIERELAKLFASPSPTRWSGATVDRVAPLIVNASPADTHTSLGRGVAQALHSAVSSTQVSAEQGGGSQ